MAIWDAIKELEELQQKAAEGKEIEDKDTFIVRAALKEKGWEGLVCEEAISRGYKEARGEEITSIPSWYTEEAIERLEEGTTYDKVLVSPEIPGPEITEEKQEISGRVFNLLGDLGREESEEQEEIREGESIEEHNQRMFEEAFGQIKKEEAMEKSYQGEGLPSMAEYDMARKEQDPSDVRHRVIVGDEVGWLCPDCSTVHDLDKLRCPICTQAEPPTVEHRGWKDAKLIIGEGDEELDLTSPSSLREYMKKHLEIRKTDKDLAIEAMRGALGLDELEEQLVIEIPDNAVECGICGFEHYLECECCLECEHKDCICCDECARYPCACDSEECPICHQDISVGEACPQGCDSEHSEIVKLYEEVKTNKDLSFGEKVKFMTLLKQKARIAEDVEDDEPVAEDDPIAEDDPDGIDWNEVDEYED
jgi:hypothetical protein